MNGGQGARGPGHRQQSARAQGIDDCQVLTQGKDERCHRRSGRKLFFAICGEEPCQLSIPPKTALMMAVL